MNRGVAAWGDKVYVGTIDGRLIALKAATGEVVWDVNTIDRDWPYTITGAPRAVKGKILIGNGGAELGVRGYITAYDAQTGKQAWRFHTVPGEPAKGFESKAMETAAKTWNGEWWKMGGGGTVWDSMAYDPELNQLYIGVGNGSPWDRDRRSPGGGDNLFLSSIVALNPDNGEYVWHYQTTPGDSWDFTATQHIMLLDLDIEGQKRKALVQAPKNGFFYVIDRTNGKLISANNYVPVTWATGVDSKTGRPIEAKNARYPDPKKPNLQFPGPFGGHNWHPMAYSPDTGLVYLSAQELPFVYQKDEGFVFRKTQWNLGVRYSAAALPEDPKELQKLIPLLKGRLLAWDPVKNEKKFSVEHPGPWNGGILAT
ncbi:MAG: PQQ-binding-like beta-propeller repeat protein, partial [Myxococcota bacterium]